MMPFSNRLGRTAALIIAAGFIAHAAGDGNLSVAVTDTSGKALAGACKERGPRLIEVVL